MKILILAAMDKELQLIENILGDASLIAKNGITLRHGIISGHDVYVGKCGIGKVNAAINTYKIIESIAPDLVINSGVAGGAGIPVGSLLIADRVAYHDVWCGPGTQYGEADGFPLFFSPDRSILDMTELSEGDLSDATIGLICSGDKFISSADEIAFIRSHFPDVKAVDMESAPIAQICTANGIPFNIVRVVSDTPGEGENVSQYKNFWTEAPNKTFNAIKTIIMNL